MFRKTSRRHAVSDVVHLHQEEALSTTILILKEFGPTGFLLKEEGESKKFKVCLGNPHTCTCLTYVKEREICRHICWVLIRKFRLPRDHEYCLQPGLVDRQINEMLQGVYSARSPRRPDTPSPGLDEEDGCVKQKDVEAEDVCPICQEELLGKRLPVSYCRYGCGNNVHISCMKVWAEHQARSEQRARSERDALVKCPLCREAFGPMGLLLEQAKNAAALLAAAERERQDRHLGVPCNGCEACPITGKCFKCVICSYYHLCEVCFKDHCHPQHPFAFRARRSQRWVSLRHSARQKSDESQDWGRQSTEEQDSAVRGERVPEQILKSLRAVEVRPGSKLLKPGLQCRLCLKSFGLGQRVKRLPCHHQFHADCADAWLLRSNCCPLDGHVVYNPLTWRGAAGRRPASECGPAPGARRKGPDQLFVPGLGLRVGPPPHAPAGPRLPPPPPREEPAPDGPPQLPPVKKEDPDGPRPPPLKGPGPAPRRNGQWREPAGGEAGGATAAAGAGRSGRGVARDRPRRGPFAGLSGLEMQVHSRETSGLVRAPPLRRCPASNPAPNPAPASPRERALILHISVTPYSSPHGETRD